VAAYAVRLTTGARSELQALAEPLRQQVRRALHRLGSAPRQPGATLLSGTRAERIWRIGVGDYRVIYQILDAQLVVLVIRIGHRREVYRGRHGG
jgi:mRNA interferase RelE/StbE